MLIVPPRGVVVVERYLDSAALVRREPKLRRKELGQLGPHLLEAWRPTRRVTTLDTFGSGRGGLTDADSRLDTATAATTTTPNMTREHFTCGPRSLTTQKPPPGRSHRHRISRIMLAIEEPLACRTMGAELRRSATRIVGSTTIGHWTSLGSSAGAADLATPSHRYGSQTRVTRWSADVGARIPASIISVSPAQRALLRPS